MITYRIIVVSVIILATMGQIVEADGSAHTWGHVESYHGAERMGQRRIVESRASLDLNGSEDQRGVIRSYDILPEALDVNQESSMWLWTFLPDRIELRYGYDGRLQSIDLRLHEGSRRYPLKALSSSRGRCFLDSSLLLCLFALGEVSADNTLAPNGMLALADKKRIQELQKCTITMRLVSDSGVNTLLHRYTGLDIIKKMLRDKENLDLRETFVATETASSGQDIGFLDIPDMPIDGGIGGRRQRLWMSNAGNDIGMSLIMDLKRRTPKFGHELDAFWSGHSVQFIPSSAETITNDLFSHIRVAVAEEQPRKKVRLAPKEIDKRLYGSPWHWEILWTVGNETLNGLLKDNVGQPRWENSRFSEQRRELIFEWSSNPSDDISPANIPVPSRIVLKRDDVDMKLAEIDVYGRGMGKDQGCRVFRSVLFRLKARL